MPDFRCDDTGKINRSDRLTLFVLGACHTFLGKRNQHKGFVQLCREKGWWEVFSAEKPEERADEWMRVLDQYIDHQVDASEYEMWMNRFPAIYRIARRMERRDLQQKLMGREIVEEVNHGLKTYKK